jgi:hypothetical protein
MEAFTCALQFDTAGPDFVRGVEVGRLWEMLKVGNETVEEIVHISNAEMILRMAEATSRPVRSEEIDDTWVRVIFDAV